MNTLYQHERSYYTYNHGAGWTRTNVRYGTCGNSCEEICADWHFPMSNNIMALHTNFYYPGVQLTNAANRTRQHSTQPLAV